MDERPSDSATCASCGRAMPARRGPGGARGGVRWCSAACRTRKVTATDAALEAAIIGLLDHRGAGATICPSEAARAVAGDDGWTDLMEPARRAARRLMAQGRVDITQGGRVVDPSTAKGPIRIRRRRPPAEPEVIG